LKLKPRYGCISLDIFIHTGMVYLYFYFVWLLCIPLPNCKHITSTRLRLNKHESTYQDADLISFYLEVSDVSKLDIFPSLQNIVAVAHCFTHTDNNYLRFTSPLLTLYSVIDYRYVTMLWLNEAWMQFFGIEGEILNKKE
jgi:hypothetical protein